MIFKKDDLLNFVRKASLSGSIESFNMDFREEGIFSCVKGLSNLTMTRTFLPAENVEGYDAIGEIYVRNVLRVIKYLKSFIETIEFDRQETHILRLEEDEREIFMFLADKNGCENIYRGDALDIPVEVEYKLNKSDLISPLKDMADLAVDRIAFDLQGDICRIEIGDKDETDMLITKVCVDNKTGKNARVVVADLIKSVIISLDKEFTLEYATNSPLRIREEINGLLFSCVIGPIVEYK